MDILSIPQRKALNYETFHDDEFDTTWAISVSSSIQDFSSVRKTKKACNLKNYLKND